MIEKRTASTAAKPAPSPAPGRRTALREAAAVGRLAWPLVIANLGLIAIQTTDALMVARIGATQFAAVGLAGHIAAVVTLFCSGVAQITAPQIAQKLGRKADDAHGVRTVMRQSLWLNLMISAPLSLALWDVGWILDLTGQAAEIRPYAVVYLRHFLFAIPVLTAVVVLNGVAAALARPGGVLAATLVAVVVNIVGNYVFIFGPWGLPAFGVKGAAFASILSASAQAAAMLFILRGGPCRRWRLFEGFEPPKPALLRRLLVLGAPVGGILLIEVGFFTAAALVMGRFGADALAAHQVAIQVVTFTLMIALGVSQATSVRVAAALGRGDRDGVRRAALAGLGLIAAAMSLFALLIGATRTSVAALYVDPISAPGAIAASLLLIAAAFQLFDGLQTVAAGALRGLDDTRAPVLMALVGYWGVGVPLAVHLSGRPGAAAADVWFAMAAALVAMSAMLVPRLHVQIRKRAAPI